ncbi:MAG: hypothetical protein K2K08_08180 [Paramuribaculum sp.]|nr:hypothetical protein [Paramuribaculum sp.]
MKRFLLVAISVVFAMANLCAEESVSAKLPAGFAWGVDIGGAIDLTGNDMSTININAAFGYRRGVIDFIGLGAGMSSMVSNSSRMFPVYGVLRTNFRTVPSLCFLDTRIGCSFINMHDNSNHTGFYLSPGIGFNLAKGKSFASYLVLSYQYVNVDTKSESGFDIDGLNYACLRLGVSF